MVSVLAGSPISLMSPSMPAGESKNRRMNKDYEKLCASAEAFVHAAMIRLMVRRVDRG